MRRLGYLKELIATEALARRLSLTFRLPKDLRKEVQAIADQTNHYKTDVIRKALNELVAPFHGIQCNSSLRKAPVVWSKNMFALSNADTIQRKKLNHFFCS